MNANEYAKEVTNAIIDDLGKLVTGERQLAWNFLHREIELAYLRGFQCGLESGKARGFAEATTKTSEVSQ